MGLTIITGRVNAGKSGWLYDRLEASARGGLAPVLLLPTQPDVRRAEQEFARRDATGISITVLETWLWEMWRLHGDGRRPVDAGARTLLASRAIDEARANGLGPSCETPGFATLVAELARRAAGFAPEGTPDTLGGALAGILDRYRRLLCEDGLVEVGEAGCVLGRSGVRLDGPVAVNRFTDLAPWQECLLVSLANKGDVFLALAWEQDAPATQALDGLVKRLANHGELVDIQTTSAEGELPRLERDLFADGRIDMPGGAVTLAESVGREAEITLSGDMVAQLLGQGYAPERIAVVFRDLEHRAAALAREFAARGIEAELDFTMLFPRTSLGGAALALLDFCSGRVAQRERLLAYLMSPYCSIARERIELADAGWRRKRIRGQELLDEALSLERTQDGPIHLGVELAAEGAEAAEDGNKWKLLAETFLLASARYYGIASREWLLDAAAHRAWMRVVSDAAGLPGFAADEASVSRALRECMVSTGSREREGAIQVTEAHRVRSRRFDAVVVGGLTSDEFSSERPQTLGSALLTEMNVPTGAEESLRERMLFYSVVTRARHKLVLMRQVADSEGRAKRPSAFWEAVLDLYRDPADADLPGYPDGMPVVQLSVHDAALAAPAFSARRRLDRQSGVGPPVARPRRGSLSKPRLEAHSEGELSVTELETYIACPYRWFLTSVVSPQKIDRSFGAIERGSRAHQILARFYHHWQGRVTSGELETALALLRRAADEVAAEARVQTCGVAEELAAARALQWARSIVLDDVTFLPGFVPEAQEWRFGAEFGRAVAVGGVSLKGSIDRIDVGPAGIVVTDYKSSGVRGRASFETYGLIQLPTYALVLRDLRDSPVIGGLYRSMSSMETRGFVVASEVELCGHGSAADEVESADIDELLEVASSRLCDAAEGIRSGMIERRPLRKDSCRFCLTKRLCAQDDGVG